MLQEAGEWFNERKSEWIFYFENICEALGINPQYFWEGRCLGSGGALSDALMG